MKFDMVFDVQKAFRKVVEAFSYPGDIVSFQEEGRFLEDVDGCYPATMILMHMLLDTDTSFGVDSVDNQLALQCSKMTHARSVSFDKADYIFVTKEHSQRLAEIIEEAKEGTLENPHQSATFIIECEQLIQDGDLILEGCGILDEKRVTIQMEEAWLDAREKKNHEFPLGIDMILTDVFGNVMALPRTIRIKKG